MGWMEVLALLKRIAPLLNRLAPMLEAFMAGRVSGKTDSQAMERLSGDIQGQLAATGEQHADLAAAVRAQATHFAELTSQIGNLRTAGKATDSQLHALQASLTRFRRLALIAASGLLILTAACLGLLLMLLLHRKH